jgi:hypothetical protein
MSWEAKLFDGWNIGGLIGTLAYAEWVVIFSILVRLFVTWVRAAKPREWGVPPEFVDRWMYFFFPSRNLDLDPTILGTLELSVYPILMKVEAWTVIGAWLAFKTVGKWKAWEETRAPYNLFLIGNATVLALSFLLANVFVHAQPVPCGPAQATPMPVQRPFGRRPHHRVGMRQQIEPPGPAAVALRSVGRETLESRLCVGTSLPL